MLSKSTLNGKSSAVLVIGGGVTGVQAALDLAECGVRVYLVEMSPAIGGKMAQLDKTFPTNDCAMCILAPKLVECARHRNIEVLTNAEVVGLEGGAGNFLVKVKRKPRYVDINKCTGCGTCARFCPVKVPDEFNEGLSERKAIYIKYPQAVPRAYAIDMRFCRKCGACVKKCEAGAINLEDVEREEELSVGAVIVACGYRLFDPSREEEYGFGRYPNVMSRMQFERMLSASGPTTGKILRPSDSKEPCKVAFLQCIGSRDHDHNYCSSFCCMYATKQAILVKEHLPEADCRIFITDMRAFGKGFQAYYHRAKDDYGVKYVRCRVSAVRENPASRGLMIKYQAEDGAILEEEFDVVVLSVGGEPSKSITALSRSLGIKLDQHGFCETGKFSPFETNLPGIYVCGSFIEPMDIPDSVMLASGSVAKALSLLASGNLVKERKYPPERVVRREGPRIGVFVCHCGTNIAGVVNVKRVAESASSLPDVVHSETLLYACSEDSLRVIKSRVKELSLNRVVVASCTPRTHEELFRETLREASLNPYLFEMVNIRDQCSWVHSKEPAKATEKALDLMRMSVARAQQLEPLHRVSFSLKRRALIVGGGLAGMTAALDLAKQEIEVVLVERSAELGGKLKGIYYTIEGPDPQVYLGSIIQKVEKNPLVKVYKRTKVLNNSGFVGNFKTTLVSDDDKKEIVEHGVTIIATGAELYRGKEYLLDQDPRVITLSDFEEMIACSPAEVAKISNVVMIQCVSPKGRDFCSRICCSTAIKNALKIKEMNPAANVSVLYKDIRTYGTREFYYTLARQKGVIFTRYTDEEPPKVWKEGDVLGVKTKDLILDRDILIFPDLVVLSTAVVSSEANKELAPLFKLPLNEDGFFLEAHAKLRPVDFSTDGFFLCGMAHYPKFIEESIAQASAAAARALRILKKDELRLGGAVAQVDEDKCIACLTCVRVCPYSAPFIDEKGKANIATFKCQGCGTCAAECPAKAIQLLHFKDDQILAECSVLSTRSG